MKKKTKKIHKFIKIIVTQQYFKCEGRIRIMLLRCYYFNSKILEKKKNTFFTK